MASPRRLLIFIPSMGGGGAERVVANLANHWADAGWYITVVTLASRKLDFYELRPAVQRVALELAGDSGNALEGLWNNVRRVIALRRLLREAQPDFALGIMTSANVLLAFAAAGVGIRAIGSEHVHPPQYPVGALWGWLRHLTYRRLDAVAALTSESADWLKTRLGIRRVWVIPNAAPWPLPSQQPRLSPESICPAGRHLLLAVGRLHRQKGFDWLLESFEGLAKKYPNWDIVILGEGPLRSALEAQRRTLGLEARVFLPGRVGNLGVWYDRAELYVMSSRFEGFGNTLAEALTYGVPAISFNCDTGPRDIVRHEIDGLLVPPEDVAGLARAMDRMMGNADLRLQFSRRAVEARERFSIRRIAGMWEKLFEEIRK
ncbi:MAG: glycosyltransferase family 4 protein [Polaromonas sp.]|uniref:glycosyltransferase family 4 protein n=1 Tax=Polaromonas sp. TaxID=1869339 RepID=UPI002736C918|nr:glycosyltransferase family 4 protein [Polaromonas sp.]MDP3798988.1 glycosyltransferase family 4 protein [Polaromonas sp.]